MICETWSKHLASATLLADTEHNHFNLVNELADPESLLFKHTMDQIADTDCRGPGGRTACRGLADPAFRRCLHGMTSESASQRDASILGDLSSQYSELALDRWRGTGRAEGLGRRSSSEAVFSALPAS
jgi:hypothetical protein